MHTCESTFFSRPTVLAKAVRALVGVAVAGVAALAWATAGPGNYDHLRVVRVTLPQVTVIAQREPAVVPATTAAVAGCERAQLDAARGSRKLG